MNYPVHPPLITSGNTWVCILLIISGSFSMMGCVYTQPASTSSSDSYRPNMGADSMGAHSRDGFDQPERSYTTSRKALLDEQTAQWLGTPHRWGGTSRSGIDCSALVQQVYGDIFDLSIPRTTREQVRVGDRISPSELEIGDLVFYKINFATRHVGIYVGDNSFLHASKSEGVTVSSLDTPYWRSRFWMARRILPEEHHFQQENRSDKKVQVTW